MKIALLTLLCVWMVGCAKNERAPAAYYQVPLSNGNSSGVTSSGTGNSSVSGSRNSTDTTRATSLGPTVSQYQAAVSTIWDKLFPGIKISSISATIQKDDQARLRSFVQQRNTLSQASELRAAQYVEIRDAIKEAMDKMEKAPKDRHLYRCLVHFRGKEIRERKDMRNLIADIEIADSAISQYCLKDVPVKTAPVSDDEAVPTESSDDSADTESGDSVVEVEYDDSDSDSDDNDDKKDDSWVDKAKKKLDDIF